MRVDLVVEDGSLDGGASGDAGDVTALARALAGAGLRVTIRVRRARPGLPERARLAPGVSVHHVPAGPARPLPPADLLPLAGLFGSRLQDAWAAERPDLVHAHGWRAGLAALAAARPHGVPVVQSFHALGAVERRHADSGGGEAPPERVVLERGIMREAARIVAASREDALELVREGADRLRVTVVPSGIDTGVFHPDGTREYRTGARPRAVYAGLLAPRGGVDDALRAIAMLPGTEPVIAGGPPRAAMERDAGARRVRGLIAALGIADRVQLRGMIDAPAVATLMRSADAVVCPARHGPCDVAALRAMACGVPVVGTPAGGTDALVDGVTGVLAPPGDPRRLAGALARPLADRSLRARMGAAAVRGVRRHAWERVGRDTARVYRSVVADGRWAGREVAAPAGGRAASPREGALAG